MCFLSIEVFKMYIMERNNSIKYICNKYVLKFATCFILQSVVQ